MIINISILMIICIVLAIKSILGIRKLKKNIIKDNIHNIYKIISYLEKFGEIEYLKKENKIIKMMKIANISNLTFYKNKRKKIYLKILCDNKLLVNIK